MNRGTAVAAGEHAILQVPHLGNHAREPQAGHDQHHADRQGEHIHRHPAAMIRRVIDALVLCKIVHRRLGFLPRPAGRTGANRRSGRRSAPRTQLHHTAATPAVSRSVGRHCSRSATDGKAGCTCRPWNRHADDGSSIASSGRSFERDVVVNAQADRPGGGREADRRITQAMSKAHTCAPLRDCRGACAPAPRADNQGLGFGENNLCDRGPGSPHRILGWSCPPIMVVGRLADDVLGSRQLA